MAETSAGNDGLVTHCLDIRLMMSYTLSGYTADDEIHTHSMDVRV